MGLLEVPLPSRGTLVDWNEAHFVRLDEYHRFVENRKSKCTLHPKMQTVLQHHLITVNSICGREE